MTLDDRAGAGTNAQTGGVLPGPGHVARLDLTNFRSYAALRLDVGPAPVVLTGANGAGKTNLLEALSFLAPGRGFGEQRCRTWRAFMPGPQHRPGPWLRALKALMARWHSARGWKQAPAADLPVVRFGSMANRRVVRRLSPSG
jgi:hypothetical protein